MKKKIICEWGDCQKEATIFVNMEEETYAFCSDEHKDEFWESIKDNY